MRVLLIVHGFPPAASGGTEVYTRDLALALAARGHEVSVLAREADPGRPEYGVRRRQDGAIGVITINNTFQSCTSFEDSYAHPALLRVATPLVADIAPDVVHVQHLTCLSTGLPQSIQQLGVPVVMTLNDYWMICHRGQLFDASGRPCAGPFDGGCDACVPPGALAAPLALRAGRLALASRVPGVAGLARRTVKAVESCIPAGGTTDATLERLRHMRAAARHVDLFLAPSATLESWFLRFGIPRAKLARCAQGIDLTPFAAAVRQASDRLRVGYAGGLIPSKAPHLLLQAAASLPHDVTVDVLGLPSPFHGDDSYARDLAPLLGHQRIRRIGPVPHDRMAQALAAVDVLVVPSVWIENAPFIIREAFAAGVPVVASGLGGMAEMVRHEIDGLLFPPGDADALGRALSRLAAEPDLLPRLRAGIQPPWSIADDAAATSGIYESLRRSPRRARAKPAAPKGDVAAVVLNYRTSEQTWLAARMLETSATRPRRIVVVDNGSGDGSAERLRESLPGVEVIALESNLGFSGGCNAGLRAVLTGAPAFALLVNSDVVMRPDALDALLSAAAEHPGAGVLAPVLLSREEPDRIASAGIAFHAATGRMRHRAAGRPMPLLQPPHAHDVDAVSGAVMLIRTEVLRRVGLLDERYFFSFEDIDFCLRARTAGFRVLCVPDAAAYHEGGRSIGRRSARRVYFATRNHLRLAARARGSRPIATAARGGLIVGLNALYALTSRDVPLFRGLAAVTRGTWHHLRGRYGID
jgi:GT2 family glycosyltransferase/glycosyltransferase involved in cell wall biosynthesis